MKLGLSKSAESALRVVGSPTDLEPDPLDSNLLRATFTLEGAAESRRVQVGCQVDGLEPVFVEVQVVPAQPIDREILNGFAFHRQTYSVRHGGRRTVLLRAGPNSSARARPKLRLDDASVAAIRQVGEFELVPGTSYYEAVISIEGRKPNGRTKLVARANGSAAECRLQVVEKQEAGVELKFRLVDDDLGANYRAAWDRQEPNCLLITTKHESIRRYLGAAENGYPGQHGEAFRILLAELISDNVCRRIVEEHARSQPHDFDSDKIYLLHNRLMKEFTPIAHRVQVPSPSIPQ